MRRFLALACLLVAVRADAGDRPLIPEASPPAIPDRPNLPVAKVSLDLSGVYDTNIDRRPAGPATFGMEAGVLARIKSRARDPRFRLEYEGSIISYSEADHWNRIKHRVEGIGALPVAGPLSAELLVEMESRGATEDRELANQYTLSPRLVLEPARRLHAIPFAGYAARELEGGARRNETILFGGLELEGSVRPWFRWELEYRHEEITADVESNAYLRNRWSGEVEATFGADRFTLGMEYRHRHYKSRRVDADPGGRLRWDDRLNPEAAWKHAFPWGQAVKLGYEFGSVASNDPDEPYSGHRITMTVSSPLVR